MFTASISKAKSENVLVCQYVELLIERLRSNGRIRTAETYRAAIKSFRHFLQDVDKLLCETLTFTDLSPSLVESYESWLGRRGVSLNTVSFYMRVLRAVYNRAVDVGVVSDARPFRRVYTGVGKTVKRALPLNVVSSMQKLDLSGLPGLDFARNVFMLSFMLRGMSFVDMAFLRESDLRNGFLTYRRRKTGQLITIQWTDEMQHLIARMDLPKRPGFLLPLIPPSASDERTAYLSASSIINRRLKKIGAMLGLKTSLSLYVARHSWASIAQSKGIPLSVISQGLGHDSEMTTRIYLTTLDNSLIDQANSMIISSL